jgi:hypothetical protein
MPLFRRNCRFQEVGQMSDQTALRGDEEEAIQNRPGDHSDDRRGFLTFSLFAGRLGAKSKLAGISLNQEASL